MKTEIVKMGKKKNKNDTRTRTCIRNGMNRKVNISERDVTAHKISEKPITSECYTHNAQKKKKRKNSKMESESKRFANNTKSSNDETETNKSVTHIDTIKTTNS